jgi:hypothetical protein
MKREDVPRSDGRAATAAAERERTARETRRGAACRAMPGRAKDYEPQGAEARATSGGGKQWRVRHAPGAAGLGESQQRLRAVPADRPSADDAEDVEQVPLRGRQALSAALADLLLAILDARSTRR